MIPAPADLTEFWQSVRVAAAINPAFHQEQSVCSRCGKVLKPTRHRKAVAGEALARVAGRVSGWIKHPGEARDMWCLTNQNSTGRRLSGPPGSQTAGADRRLSEPCQSAGPE